MCFAWLIGMSFVMTVSVQAIAEKLGISDAVAGLTISAAGTSFPNLFASMIVARQVVFETVGNDKEGEGGRGLID